MLTGYLTSPLRRELSGPHLPELVNRCHGQRSDAIKGHPHQFVTVMDTPSELSHVQHNVACMDR